MPRISSHGSRASTALRRPTACRRITDRVASGLFRTKTTLILFSYKIFNKYDFQKNILPDQHIILKFITQKVKKGQKKNVATISKCETDEIELFLCVKSLIFLQLKETNVHRNEAGSCRVCLCVSLWTLQCQPHPCCSSTCGLAGKNDAESRLEGWSIEFCVTRLARGGSFFFCRKWV